jgi:hypothetical protein
MLVSHIWAGWMVSAQYSAWAVRVILGRTVSRDAVVPTRDCSRAIACLYAANPFAAADRFSYSRMAVGDSLAVVGWMALWLFILEGVPAVFIGVVTIFYLTDWPAQARWLPQEERDWLVNDTHVGQTSFRTAGPNGNATPAHSGSDGRGWNSG